MSDVDGESLPASMGRGSGLFERTDNYRSDARMVAQMLTLGVVTVEEVEGLLRQVFKLAKGAADSGKEREVAALLKVILSAAKLGQDERKLAAGPTTNIQINGDVRFGSPDERRTRLSAIAERLGTRAVAEGTAAVNAGDDSQRVIEPPDAD